MMNTLKNFVIRTLKCSYDDAEDFIRKFRHYEMIDKGRYIIENHRENFVDDFDVDDISEETLEYIAIKVEVEYTTDLGTIEDHILSEVFGDKYE